MPNPDLKPLARAVARQLPRVTADLKTLVAFPTPSGREAAAAAWYRRALLDAGCEAARIDAFGNVVGRLGRGRLELAFDAHLDTVVPATGWRQDPYRLRVRGGVAAGLGTVDQKGAAVALLAMVRLLRRQRLLPPGMTIRVIGSAREEDCEGLNWRYLIREAGLRPDAVVITEPSRLQVMRGQRGRLAAEIEFPGRAVHAAFPLLGHNPIFDAARYLKHCDALTAALPVDPVMGSGSLTPTVIESAPRSTCAVPDRCRLRFDRRTVPGETRTSVLRELRAALPPGAKLTIPVYRTARQRGRSWAMAECFPSWLTAVGDPLVRAALVLQSALGRPQAQAGHYQFSTNGCVTAGSYRIPTIGFGPGDDRRAHTVGEAIPLREILDAALLYALLPGAWLAARGGCAPK